MPASKKRKVSQISRAKKSKGNALEIRSKLNNPTGVMLAFGSGDCCQLGCSDREAMRERKKPTVLKTMLDKDVCFVSAGALHNACLTTDGELYTWGCNDDKALGTINANPWEPALVDSKHFQGQKIVNVGCGSSHTIVLTEDGKVYTWGAYRDETGLLGHSASEEKRVLPCLVEGLAGHKVIDIAAGSNHDAVLTASGQVFVWGDVNFGKRASRRLKYNKLSPAPIRFPNRKFKATQIYAGGYSTFAADEAGIVYSWGPNNYAQTGHSSEQVGVAIPQLVNTQKKVPAYIAAADYHAVMLTTDGNVFACGRHAYGRLGLGNTKEICAEQFTQVSFFNDKKIQGVSVGDAHTVVLTTDGIVYTVGNGDLMQLGNGQIGDLYEPFLLTSKQLTDNYQVVLQAEGGAQHNLLLARAK